MSQLHQDVLNGIALGEFHRAKALSNERIFDLDPSFFSALADEVRRLVATQSGSDPQAKGHPSNASSEPYGGITQYSLLNATGDFGDIATDHNNSTLDKWFHHEDEYPTIAELIRLLPPVFNFRINVLPPKGGFSPHQEQVSYRNGREYIYRGRFHLPIQTNPKAVLLLEEDLFHFEDGSIYYFNNGCNHSAENRGDELRIHLLWDMPLTADAIDRMFGEESYGPLVRTPKAERFPRPVGTLKFDNLIIQGQTKKWYDKLGLERIGISQRRWNSLYSAYRYGRYALGGRPRPFPPVTTSPR
jgi:hypothetical protein